MKVKDLIAQLQQLDPELEVYRHQTTDEEARSWDTEMPVDDCYLTITRTYNPNEYGIVLNKKGNPRKSKTRFGGTTYDREVVLIV